MTTTEKKQKQLLVVGYMGVMERMYKLKTIPVDICNIIYSYMKCCDEWSVKYSSHDIDINATNNMITINTKDHNTAFGQHVVEEGIFIWRIKMISIHRGIYQAPPYVGIMEDNEDNLRAYKESHS